MRSIAAFAALLWLCWLAAPDALGQTPPTPKETAAYQGLHWAALDGDVRAIGNLVKAGALLEARDGGGRTPLLVAAFASQKGAVRALAKAGANMNAVENQDYDIVTIAAVANDLELLDLALMLGARADNVTSPYHGTALIAAAHLGHYQAVRRLIEAGAPLDHVNNQGWTALMEAVVLGDGGPEHIECVRTLIAAGADQSIADKDGVTPLEHARSMGFTEIVKLLDQAS